MKMQRDVLVISMKDLNLNASLEVDDEVKRQDDDEAKEFEPDDVEHDDDLEEELQDEVIDLKAHAVDKDTDALVRMALQSADIITSRTKLSPAS